MNKREIFGVLIILTSFIGISICFLIEKRFYHVISVYGTLESTRYIFMATMLFLSVFYFEFMRTFRLKQSFKLFTYFVALSPLGLALFPLDSSTFGLMLHRMFGILLFFGVPLNLLMTHKNIKVMRINLDGLLYIFYIAVYLVLFYRGQFLHAQFLGIIYSGILILQILIPHPLKYYGILQTDKADAS